MEALARLPVFFALARQACRGGRRQRGGGVEDRAAVGRGRACRRLCGTSPPTRCWPRRKPPTSRFIAATIDDEDFAGAALAIGAFDDEAPAADFAARARAAGVPVNVVDRPALSDFSFGTIVNRSPLVVGISTDGAAPVFAQAIRAKIEAMIPHGFAALGRRRAALARGREVVRPRRSAAGAASGSCSPGTRSPIPIARPKRRISTPCSAQARHEGDVGRPRLGHPGRRRAGRSRAVDAARRARAAIGRRDPVRSARLARRARFRAARGEEACWSASPATGPACKQDEINRADDHAGARRASAWCGSRAATR